MAIVAGAGLLVALADPRRDLDEGAQAANVAGHVRPRVPARARLVGWLLVANQPGHGWQEGRLDSWSNSIGILGVVHSLGLWHGVLAFAFGLMLGLSLDGVPAPVEEAAPAYAGPAGAAPAPAADEPVAAERRYTTTRGPATPTEETTQTQTQTRTPAG